MLAFLANHPFQRALCAEFPGMFSAHHPKSSSRYHARKFDKVSQARTHRNAVNQSYARTLEPLMRVDTHDPAAQGHDLLHCSQRAAVIDITLAGGVVCALTKSGCCIAYDERTMKQLCYLNVVPNELIRSMYYNKEQNAVITVSVHKVDSFRSLRCRSIPVCSLFNKTPHKSTVMFANEPLAYPSFVEFDTYNDLVVTYASSSGAYKFWHMHDYSQLFQVKDPMCKEIKTARGTIMLLKAKTAPLRAPSGDENCPPPREHKQLTKEQEKYKHGMTIEIRNVFTGRGVMRFNVCDEPLDWEIIEHFSGLGGHNGKLMLKLRGQPLKIFDITTHETVCVSDEAMRAPRAMMCLSTAQFVSFTNNGSAELWNLRGELRGAFEGYDTNNVFNMDCVYMSKSHELMITTVRDEAASEGSNAHSTLKHTVSKLLFSSLRNGKLLVQHSVAQGSTKDKRKKLERALTNVTSLAFNEAQHTLYTADAEGIVTRWARR